MLNTWTPRQEASACWTLGHQEMKQMKSVERWQRLEASACRTLGHQEKKQKWNLLKGGNNVQKEKGKKWLILSN